MTISTTDTRTHLPWDVCVRLEIISVPRDRESVVRGDQSCLRKLGFDPIDCAWPMSKISI